MTDKNLLAGLRILVVDDSDDNLELLEYLLVKNGAEVELASDGLSATEKAARSTFAAILMDLEMPVMNGYEATRTLRNQGLQIPIYAITAHDSKEHEVQIFAAGFTGHIAKPIKAKLIIDLLASLS